MSASEILQQFNNWGVEELQDLLSLHLHLKNMICFWWRCRGGGGRFQDRMGLSLFPLKSPPLLLSRPPHSLFQSGSRNDFNVLTSWPFKQAVSSSSESKHLKWLYPSSIKLVFLMDLKYHHQDFYCHSPVKSWSVRTHFLQSTISTSVDCWLKDSFEGWSMSLGVVEN